MSQGIEQALRFHQEGQLTHAERLYRDVLRLQPRDFEALHMLGILKMQQGRPEEALRFLADAVAVDQRSVAALSNRGAALSALKRHAEALASYDQALAINPRNAETLSSRADTLCDLGQTGEALRSYEAALASDPRHVSALVNRGLLLRELGRFAEALASYDAALATASDDAEAWNNRGVVLHDLSRIDEALNSYERALALRLDYVEALLNRGNALVVLRRPAEAIASFGRVMAIQPERAEAHSGRGHALFDLSRFEEALANYDLALTKQPALHDAAIGRARTLCKLDRYADALAEYERLRRAKADIANLAGDLAHCRAVACHWADNSALVHEVTAGALDGTAAVDPFMFLSFEGTEEQQLACARHWLRRKKVSGTERAWNRDEYATGKIRIAYLSADYHRHATAHLIAELLELHDRNRFEIIGVSFGPDDRSPLRARVIKSFDRFFDVAARADADVAELLRNLRTHVAVDLKGHTTDARIGIFAHRAAPVQAAYLGYPSTTGAEFIDYVIADPVALPMASQQHYSERIIHLPDSYQVNDSKREMGEAAPPREALGLPSKEFVFCCFNNTWKINANIFDVWMRLLHAVEGSVLWLYRANGLAPVNLRKEARARGIDPARLIFAPPLDLPDHLARHKHADLFLDTLPYNAHTTASDSLWVGVPVITCKGDTFAGRVAASLLHAVGLPELVTTDLAAYEALALALASDPARLRAIRSKLEECGRSAPLFDAHRFRRHIERAYETMVEQWLEGGPRSFSVERLPL